MYAITFDLDSETLKQVYSKTSVSAYSDVADVLFDWGFTWSHGGTYFGNSEVNAVTCVFAAKDLTNCLDWFSSSVRNIRMLRIEENNDLSRAIERGKQCGN